MSSLSSLGRLPRVYLCRHGETEWSLNGKHTGRSDIPLTENGENVIRKSAPSYVGQGKLLDPSKISHIFVSPRQRAQHTFKLMREVDSEGFDNANAIFETTEEVREWDYGDYEGLKSAEIREKNPKWSIWKDGCPGGESVEQMTARVDELIEKIAKIHRDCCGKMKNGQKDAVGDVMIVSHGHYSKCFLARFARLPLERGEILVVDAGAINVGGYQHSDLQEPSLLGLNLHSYQLA